MLTDLPFIGRILFGQDAFVYLSIALVVGIWWFLYRTRAGLVLRAVGDNHTSAHALGYPVLRIRMLAVLFGGACAGLGGAFLPLAYTPFFIPGHDRRPRLDRAGAGGVRVLAAGPAGRRRLSVRRGDDPAACMRRAPGFGIPSQLMSSLPYLATIIVLVLISRARAACRIGRARVAGYGVRARPLNVLRSARGRAARCGDKRTTRLEPELKP